MSVLDEKILKLLKKMDIRGYLEGISTRPDGRIALAFYPFYKTIIIFENNGLMGRSEVETDDRLRLLVLFCQKFRDLQLLSSSPKSKN